MFSSQILWSRRTGRELPAKGLQGVDEQREAFVMYMRTVRANYQKAVREMDQIFQKRKIGSFERAMRIRRFEEAREFRRLGEASLAALNHAYAIDRATFKPGTRIVCTTEMEGYKPVPSRFIVLDVRWFNERRYAYDVWQLKKNGDLHQEHSLFPICPNTRLRIEPDDSPCSAKAEEICCQVKVTTKQFLGAVLDTGDLGIAKADVMSNLAVM
jgi:hypothetical protein